MESYRHRGLVDLPSTYDRQLARARKSTKTAVGYANYLNVQTEYDLPDSGDETDPDNGNDADHTVQSVEQEYNAWVLGDKFSADVDLFKFWEVRFNPE